MFQGVKPLLQVSMFVNDLSKYLPAQAKVEDEFMVNLAILASLA